MLVFVESTQYRIVIKALLGREEIGEKKRREKEKHGNQSMNLD
jgi:hypothetical protein